MLFSNKGNLADPKIRADTGKAVFLNKLTGPVAAKNLAYNQPAADSGALYMSDYKVGAAWPEEHKLAICQLDNGDTRIETIRSKAKDAADEHFALIFDADQRLVCVEDRIEQMVFPKGYDKAASPREMVPAQAADLYIKRLEKILAKHQEHNPIEAFEKRNLAAPSAREGSRYAFVQSMVGKAAFDVFPGAVAIEGHDRPGLPAYLSAPSTQLLRMVAGERYAAENLSIRQKNGFTSVSLDKPSMRNSPHDAYIFDADARLIAVDNNGHTVPAGFPHLKLAAQGGQERNVSLLDANPDMRYPLVEEGVAKKALQAIEAACKRHYLTDKLAPKAVKSVAG